MKIYIADKSLERSLMTIKKAETIGATIVCSCKESADVVKEDACFYGCKIADPITVQDILNGRRPNCIVIEDVESFVKELTGAEIIEAFSD